MKSSFIKTVLISLFLLPQSNASINNNVYYSFHTKEKELALTFDDGPYQKNTNQVLNILKNYNVKATFFLLGENMMKNKEPIKRIVNEGHEIGLHTYSHPQISKLNKEEIEEEIDRNIITLKQIVNYTPTVIRPPYGQINDDFLKVANDYNLKIIVWSNDSLDWNVDYKTNDIVENALSKIHPGSIILMHDKSKNYLASRKALPQIIKRCQKKGYKFKTISEFLN